jgi:phage-related protein (TIGR01555 family)
MTELTKSQELAFANHFAAWFANARLDSWQNDLTGFGTSRDKTMFSQFLPSCDLSDTTIEALYHYDDLAKILLDTEPEEMLRKGYCLNIGEPGKRDQETEAKILEALDELDANERIVDCLVWAGGFGGCALLLGCDDGRPASMPLIPERARKLEQLEVIDRRYLSVNSWYLDGPKRGQPETYSIGNPSQVSRPYIVIHETRLIMFGGARTSRLERARRGHWDHSRLQVAFEVIRTFSAGFKSVEVLLTDGPQGVYKVKNLANLIGSNRKTALQERLNEVELFRSTLRAMVVDSDQEDFTRQNFTFSGIPDVLEKLLVRLAMTFRMPVTKLAGTSPAGLNATGESDTRNWYDRLASEQPRKVGRPLRRLIQVLCATREGPTAGKPLDKLSIEFAPLWTLDPLAESQRRQNVANTDKVYFDMGAITPEEIALSRFGERGWQDGYKIDRELREIVLERENDDLREGNDTPARNPDLLTPSAKEAIITVEEARSNEGYEPFGDERDELMVAEFRAKQEAQAEVVGEADGKEETGQDVTQPDPTQAGALGAAQQGAGPGAPKPGVPAAGPAVRQGNAPPSGPGAGLPKKPPFPGKPGSGKD